MVPSQNRPLAYHRASAPDITSSSPLRFDHPDYGYRYMSTSQEHHHRQDHNLIPGMPGTLTLSECCVRALTYSSCLGSSNSVFHQIPDSLYPDSTLNALDLHAPYFQHPQSVTPISSSSSLGTDSINLDFSHLGGSQDHSSFEYELRPPSPPAPLPFIAGQNNVQGDHVIYYFEHVRKIQLIFAGNTFTNATYSVSFDHHSRFR